MFFDNLKQSSASRQDFTAPQSRALRGFENIHSFSDSPASQELELILHETCRTPL